MVCSIFNAILFAFIFEESASVAAVEEKKLKFCSSLKAFFRKFRHWSQIPQIEQCGKILTHGIGLAQKRVLSLLSRWDLFSNPV